MPSLKDPVKTLINLRCFLEGAAVKIQTCRYLQNPKPVV
jgi:hypothetical protein